MSRLVVHTIEILLLEVGREVMIATEMMFQGSIDTNSKLGITIIANYIHNKSMVLLYMKTNNVLSKYRTSANITLKLFFCNLS